MNKYITPTIEYIEIESSDVITASTGTQGYEIGALDGVDSEGSKSAIFDAGFFWNN